MKDEDHRSEAAVSGSDDRRRNTPTDPLKFGNYVSCSLFGLGN